MLKNILFLYIISFTISLSAQPRVQMDKIIHDYGQIFEPLNAMSQFVITNVGDDTLVVEKMLAQCGCTKPQVSNKVIPPGKKATVFVNYDSKGRVGVFNKKVMIYTNGIPAVQVVNIKGEVKSRQAKIGNYGSSKAELVLSVHKIDFDTVNNKYNSNYKILLENKGKIVRKIKSIDNLPIWATSNFTKTISLQPGEVFELELSFDMSKNINFGQIRNFVSIQTNDRLTPVKLISISGYMEPFIDAPKSKRKYKKWLKKQPKLEYSQNKINFGKIKTGSVVKGEITLTNQGKDTLIIYKLYSQCGCLRIEANKTSILPGEKAVLSLTFDSINRRDRQRKQGYIITNDPLNKKVFFFTEAFVTL